MSPNASTIGPQGKETDITLKLIHVAIKNRNLEL